jgi:hypothetical protein
MLRLASNLSYTASLILHLGLLLDSGLSRESHSCSEFQELDDPNTMSGSNPVVLVALLTAASLVITIFKYHEAPGKVPIWWDLHGALDWF